MKIQEVLKLYQHNPYNYTCHLDSVEQEPEALELYKIGRDTGLLRKLDQSYLAQYGIHPKVKEQAKEDLGLVSLL